MMQIQPIPRRNAPIAATELPALRVLLDRMDGAMADPASLRHLLAEAAALLESLPDTALPPAEPPSSGTGLAPWQERRLREHIDARLHHRLPIAELAASVRLSRSHFSRAFRASFGLPPHAYVLQRRIQEAQRLMLETVDSLAEIACACGLADQAHLSRLFRRETGLPPNAWRRQHRGAA